MPEKLKVFHFGHHLTFQFTCHVDPAGLDPTSSVCPLVKECSGDLGDDLAEPTIDTSACHRWCPLPQYAVLSCLVAFMAVAVFLRLPIMIKALLLFAMALVHVLLVELSHKQIFACFDNSFQ